MIQSRQQRKHIEKEKQIGLSILWHNNKRSNIPVSVVQREEKEWGAEEIKDENYPTLTKERNWQILEAEQTPNRLNPKKSIIKHITVKLLEINTKNESWKEIERNK